MERRRRRKGKWVVVVVAVVVACWYGLAVPLPPAAVVVVTDKAMKVGGYLDERGEFVLLPSTEASPNTYYAFAPEYVAPGGVAVTNDTKRLRREVVPFPFWAFRSIPLLSGFAQLGWERHDHHQQHLPRVVFANRRIPKGILEGQQLVDLLGSVPCLGGSKRQQLLCRADFAKRQGCDFAELGIQPAQYDLSDAVQCERFLQLAEPNKSYIVKPVGAYHGDGQQVFFPSQRRDMAVRFGDCAQPVIAMEYVDPPATMMGGYKFDFRTFLLVASLRPVLAFQYEFGVVRRSKHVYTTRDERAATHILNSRDQSADEHLYGFADMSRALAGELGLARDHFPRVVLPRLHKVAKFLVATQFASKPFRFPRGRFQVFALDWVLDRGGGVHLLESNGSPALFDYDAKVADFPADCWHSCAELVEMVHLRPERAPRNMTTRLGFAHKHWRMVYNYVEHSEYNACEEFG